MVVTTPVRERASEVSIGLFSIPELDSDFSDPDVS